MQQHEIKIIVKEYDSIDELEPGDVMLIERAKSAALNAYAPYSNFRVGAALLMENGDVIEGNNQENAAYPSGLCAERVAMFYANSRYPDKAIETIAITAFSVKGLIDDPVAPCGSCRQSMLESEIRFRKPIRLILVGKKKIRMIESVKSLLPLNFNNDFLVENNQ